MAEEHGQDRTEAPTPRRREEARKRGQVALSPDLTGSLLLLGGIMALWFQSRALADSLLGLVRRGLLESGCTTLGLDNVGQVFLRQALRGLELTGWFLGLLFVVGVVSGLLQAGFGISSERLAPNWERLSPAQGFQRMFSLAAGGRALLGVLKVAAVALVAFVVLRGRVDRIATMSVSPLAASVGEAWELMIRLALAVAGALVVLGVIDYFFRWFSLERSLHMTRQELKEEVKREEGDPAFKARIRKVQRSGAQRRMLKDVPAASVVVTNPSHLAIALRYDRGSMPAPRVVAKGSGLVAKRIVETARRHAVPVVERKPLARALFKAVQVGQEIPAALYYAVAEVLAYVYRLRTGTGN